MYRIVYIVMMLLLAMPALAKDKDKRKGKDGPAATIEMIGLPSLDAVFVRVAAIDQKLTNARGMLATAKRGLNDALALEKGASLQEGLASFKKKAAGKLSVSMVDGVPMLKPKGAVPADVQAGIDAVNDMVRGITGSIVELKTIPAEATALAQAAAKLPKQLKQDALAAGLKPTEIPRKLKILKSDIEVTAALPEKATAVVDRMTGLLATVSSLAKG